MRPVTTEDDLKAYKANMARGGATMSPMVKAFHKTTHPIKSHSPLTQTFFIHGPLPGANDIIRKHHMVYSKLKAQWGLTIARCIIVAKLKRVKYCTIAFLWHEPNNRRDDDNVMFAQKFILDALRDTKIIPDDRRQFIHSLVHRVIVEPTMPGVQVTVEEV